jgi:single-strand DNA-binding protein
VNHVVLIGRAASDVRMRYSAKGQPVATFGLAVHRPGNVEVDFVEIVAFNRLAEVLGTHLHRGRLIAVKGRLKCRHIEVEGGRRKLTEVVAETIRFLDRPRLEERGEDVHDELVSVSEE